MQVKLLQTLAGESGVFTIGQVVELPEAQAQRWIARGWVAPITKNPIREAVENAPKKRKAVQR